MCLTVEWSGKESRRGCNAFGRTSECSQVGNAATVDHLGAGVGRLVCAQPRNRARAASPTRDGCLWVFPSVANYNLCFGKQKKKNMSFVLCRIPLLFARRIHGRCHLHPDSIATHRVKKSQGDEQVLTLGWQGKSKCTQSLTSQLPGTCMLCIKGVIWGRAIHHRD